MVGGACCEEQEHRLSDVRAQRGGAEHDRLETGKPTSEPCRACVLRLIRRCKFLSGMGFVSPGGTATDPALVAARWILERLGPDSVREVLSFVRFRPASREELRAAVVAWDRDAGAAEAR